MRIYIYLLKENWGPLIKIMNNIKDEIVRFEQYIADNIKSQLTHNHVPVTGLVKNCNYCKLFGNVFTNGPISSKENSTYKTYIVYTCQN